MNDWTIFYWGWWIAWSPFVGMFIAKISRGMPYCKITSQFQFSQVIVCFLVCIIDNGMICFPGRTIRDFITYTLTIPCLYSFLWMSIFGGVGIKMDNLARAANLTCDSPLGGKQATESFNGLYLLSCRYILHNVCYDQYQ